MRLRSVALLVLIIALAGLGFWFFNRAAPELPPAPFPTTEPRGPERAVIGRSVAGRVIESYTFGAGTTTLLFVGGVHGGYEWNSVLLAYNAIDYLTANPAIVPSGLKLVIVPAANPDGVFAVTGKDGRFAIADVASSSEVQAAGRFNQNGVDLNRNFACKWQPKATWRSKEVSAGTAAFSEPEAAALRDWVLANKPAAAIFWHSQANAVYASECEQGILPATLAIMKAYATAAGYPSVSSFDAYPVTGDAEGWLASIGIPAITVELKTHETIEWPQNLAGIKALINYHDSN